MANGDFFGLNIRRNEDEWSDAIERMRERNRRLSSLRPIMIRVAQLLRYETIKNFDSEGAHAGKPWEKNKEPYASWKRGERSGGVGGSWLKPAKSSKVLHRYLELRNALTVLSHPDHIEMVRDKGRHVTVGLRPGSWTADLARIHREGATRPGTKWALPARNPFIFNRNADHRARDLVENYIESGFIPDAASLKL